MDPQNQTQAPATPESQNAPAAPADSGAQNAGAVQVSASPATQDSAPQAAPTEQQAAPATTATEMQPSEQELANAMAGKIGGVVVAVEFALIIAVVAAHMKIFSKAQEAGWKALVPFYNLWVLLRVVRLPGWYMILMLIPLVNLYVFIRLYHRLSRSFGQGAGFTLGLIFLPFIFIPILAFSKAEYRALED